MLPQLKNFSLPDFEHILNSPPFSTYREFLEDHDVHDPLVSPSNTMLLERKSVERAFGHQLGVIRSKHETDPLVQPGLGKYAHMKEACRLAAKGDHQ